MTDPKWLTESEDRAWRGLHEMNRALDHVLSRRLGDDSGLSMADYELLVPLSEAAGRRLRARDLGQLVQWEKSRLSKHVSRMEQRGLVSRQECSADARGSFICLTEAGWVAITAAAPDHVEAVRRYFVDLLDAGELRMFAEVSDRVVARASEGAGPTDPCD
ncbi:MAG: hypothetical protein QG671_483 [Actinomycetota bacterium]|nr:hypothetical protein [Actinomycetota bacterium]